MYIKRKDVLEAVKGYFCGLIDAGTKDVDVVDCGVELQRIVDKVPGTGWIRVEDKLPPEGEVVLVIVDGKYGNIEFVDAIEMGSYYPEGWLLESYHKITDPDVSYWMELPDGPENGEG